MRGGEREREGEGEGAEVRLRECCRTFKIIITCTTHYITTHLTRQPTQPNTASRMSFILSFFTLFPSSYLRAQVELIFEELLVVGPHIKHHGEDAVGGDPSGSTVEGEFSNGNTLA